jgi:hypothetical protein
MSGQDPIEEMFVLGERINNVKAKVTSEDLDEIIHEVFSLKASKVNNQGLDEQVATLIIECGAEETVTILEDIAREKGGVSHDGDREN